MLDSRGQLLILQKKFRQFLSYQRLPATWKVRELSRYPISFSKIHRMIGWKLRLTIPKLFWLLNSLLICSDNSLKLHLHQNQNLGRKLEYSPAGGQFVTFVHSTYSHASHFWHQMEQNGLSTVTSHVTASLSYIFWNVFLVRKKKLTLAKQIIWEIVPTIIFQAVELVVQQTNLIYMSTNATKL